MTWKKRPDVDASYVLAAAPLLIGVMCLIERDYFWMSICVASAILWVGKGRFWW
jgi:hypothetical protein